MAQILVSGTETLLAGNHALMHNVYTIDGNSPIGAVYVAGTNGNVCILSSGTQPMGTQPAAALDVYGDILGSGATWADYSSVSTIGGISPVTKSIYAKKIGKTALVNIYVSGTSSASTITITLPYQSASTGTAQGNYYLLNYVDTNGTASVGAAFLPLNSSTVTFYSSVNMGSFTNGTSTISGQFFYQTQ